MDHLPPDEIAEKQEYKGSYEVIDYYFDTFVQGRSIGIKNNLPGAKAIQNNSGH
jgi:hypothetical protein